MLIADHDDNTTAEPVTTEGITRVGFIQLQAEMIRMERLDLVWHMLFRFGYSRTLALSPLLFSTLPDRAAAPVRRPTTRALLPATLMMLQLFGV